MSFYDNMARVASDLIAKFGQEVTLIRDSEVFHDPVEGLTGTGERLTLTPKGILKTYPDRLIDGTRIHKRDRLLVLDPSVEPLMTDTVELQGRRWTIHDIQASNPAGTPLVYFVQVRR